MQQMLTRRHMHRFLNSRHIAIILALSLFGNILHVATHLNHDEHFYCVEHQEWEHAHEEDSHDNEPFDKYTQKVPKEQHDSCDLFYTFKKKTLVKHDLLPRKHDSQTAYLAPTANLLFSQNDLYAIAPCNSPPALS